MVLSKRAEVSWLLKMLIGVAVIVAFLFLGSSLISYGKTFLGGIIGGKIDACPSDLLEPRKCYCGSELLNANIKEKSFDPDNTKAYCCDGTAVGHPCACTGVNSCDDYNKKFPESVAKRTMYCERNLCSQYFGSDRRVEKCMIGVNDKCVNKVVSTT